MAQTVVLAGNNVGGLVQGLFGTYQPSADGTYTVDTRDVAALLAMGMTFIRRDLRTYNIYPTAPSAASTTRFIASTTLSNGALTFAAQPDVMRQVALVINQLASPGPSAGTLSITYTGNDGVSTTDSFALNGASVAAAATFNLSKGVVHFTTGTVSGLTGSGYITLGSTNYLGLPLSPSAPSSDITIYKENTDAGDAAAPGTLATSTLGVIIPSVAPNGTHTYGWVYGVTAPET